ncbi:MAG TPA: type II toxin-antitoxin system Phd/YefM family antitoxin [Kofleriaceae bacterium]|nr:type II toxin-antitoxin system Phd/YefM family antitoxin [Kofleriaceae bacterium]
MRTPRTEPVTAVKRRATEIIADLRTERRPVIITERGRSAAVLLDIASYDELTARLDLLEGLARGERAIREGRVVSHAAAKQRMRRWHAGRG